MRGLIGLLKLTSVNQEFASLKVKKPTPSWMDPKNDTKPPIIIRTLLLATLLKNVKNSKTEESKGKQDKF